MKERQKMYSCILHDELEKGGQLTALALTLGIPISTASKLVREYKECYRLESAMSLSDVVRMKKNAASLLRKTRLEAAELYELRKSYRSFAFHMPISEAEHREYMAIKKLVDKDEYLSPGYRKPKEDKPIVNNKNIYR